MTADPRPLRELGRRIADRLTYRQALPCRIRQVQIDAVTAGPATVSIRLGGSSVVVAGVKYLAGYTPVAADIAWALQLDSPDGGSDFIVIGKTAA